MIPSPFEYVRPETLEEALQLLSRHGDGAKLLAGGQSLIPAMKFRLAQPGYVIDLSQIPQLDLIQKDGDTIRIGAMTTHHQIESSNLLRQECPVMCRVAEQIGDVQVRNRGSLGGSLVHADPAADWPAIILALEADLVIRGEQGERRVAAKDFFSDMMQTAVGADEILSEIRIPSMPEGAAYVKSAQKASGFALAGVAVVLASRRGGGGGGGGVAVGITGVAAIPYRARAVERALEHGPITRSSAAQAARHAVDGMEPLSDIHASEEYRAHLACVNAKRALFEAARLG